MAEDKLFADEIQKGLRTKWVGKEIFSYEELDSTNSTAWKLGEGRVKEGACVFSEHQTKGRGRLGRSWSSPRSRNILLSILLRPKVAPSDIAKLTLAASVAVRRAVKAACGIELSLKWPNDLIYKDKKVCGILTEMSAEADRVQFVVLGLGLNVNATASELPPVGTSLREISGCKIDRVELSRRLLEEMEAVFGRLKKNDFESIAEEWEEYSSTTGRRVVAHLADRKVQGMAVGIDKDGALWLRHDNGLQERILSGDIQHLR